MRAESCPWPVPPIRIPPRRNSSSWSPIRRTWTASIPRSEKWRKAWRPWTPSWPRKPTTATTRSGRWICAFASSRPRRAEVPIRIRAPIRLSARFSWAGAMAWIYLALLLLLLCLSAFLWKSGDLLVHADPPGRLRWAAVLSGEGRDMELSESAWGLYQEGLFDSLILMGPRVFKSRYASEFAAGHLETRGFPGDHLFQLRNEDR